MRPRGKHGGGRTRLVRPSRPASAAAAVFALAAGSCTATVTPAALSEMFRGEEIRTFAVEPSFTLVSPYSVGRTVPFVHRVDANLRAVTALFEVELPRRVLVFLEPVDVDVDAGPAPGVRTPMPHRHGVVGAFGYARDDELAILVIVPREDASRPTSEVFVFGHDETIRHEIAHLCAGFAGLSGPTWFEEALAIEVETMRLDGERLVGVREPAPLAIARSLPRSPVATLLDWRERGGDVLAGREEPFVAGRPLAFALLRYLLLQRPTGTFVERLEAIGRLGRSDLVALEAGWHRWLDEGVLQ